MKLSKKATKKWLLEVATWLRAAGGAPALLLLIVWGGNLVLTLFGKAPAFAASDPSKINLPSAILVGVVYVVFNAMATWVEIKADEIREDTDPPHIILPDRFQSASSSKRSRPGGDSS